MSHDAYGKQLIRLACDSIGVSAQLTGTTRQITPKVSCAVDGIVGGTIAVEVESRVNKQIRGSLLDLWLYPLARKLMIILPVHMKSSTDTCEMCRTLFDELARDNQTFECVAANGHGYFNDLDNDVKVVAGAIQRLLQT